MKYIIGLTGNIGCGKSVTGKIFTDLGAKVIDTDVINANILKYDLEAIELIKLKFGTQVINLDGSVDRMQLRKLIFNNNSLRWGLEQILHPRIAIEVLQQINSTVHDYIILIVPLLFKSLNYLKLINRIAVIDCAPSMIIERVLLRDNTSRDTIIKILHAQSPRALHLSLADDILYNHTTLADLTTQVMTLHKLYHSMCK